MKNGFSLLELLIAMTIFVVVAVVLYSSFASGINVWRQAKSSFDTYQNARLSLEIIARDLRNSISYEGLEFSGEKDRVSFAGLINCAEPGEPEILKIGKISYYFEETEDAIVRQVMPIGAEEDRRQLAEPVEDLNFSYFSKGEDNEYLWSDIWEIPGFRPLFVKIKATFKKPAYDEKLTLTKNISMPVTAPAKED